ncbi:hypothetical protein BU14_1264s0001 [Porphyra umbilicalis]|uniref:Uncharacterized protein n=1 Tax=Porphyra umbilicalis TaxID=2786 RepID=A0A1X6NM80_PORUM|nr:hypothetical protein BU14_1264s0001 [Porphyra umbilicalis]|eukprot:OSX69695.1 hypothetical protein BU14_1264s0001 [Porphyra umbilicalis]
MKFSPLLARGASFALALRHHGLAFPHALCACLSPLRLRSLFCLIAHDGALSRKPLTMRMRRTRPRRRKTS